MRSPWRARRERAAAAAERDARLRWVVVRHGDTVVLTNRGATAVTAVRLAVSADGATVAEGARELPEHEGPLASGVAARVVSPLTTDALWLEVCWRDPRHGEQRATLRTDVFPRPER